MYRLPQIVILALVVSDLIFSQNPHGNEFKIDCANCHTSDSWSVDRRNIDFKHQTTSFDLNGRHNLINCNECHKNLILSDVNSDCVECHTDIHNNTLPTKCNICHSEDDWIIENIPLLHEETEFPLIGSHLTLDCSECHSKSVELIFEPISSECYSCHENSYVETKKPNHVEENFSLECYQCHDLEAETWIISHDFFPLEKSHSISDCLTCHIGGDYVNTSPECINCHKKDYEKALNPDHQAGSFSQNCSECHTLDPGWTPAKYENHDEIDFPIFSGKHKGEWSQCTDCHQDPGNYSIFTCIDCHKHGKAKMDRKHRKENGYAYESQACYKCHPDGSE